MGPLQRGKRSVEDTKRGRGKDSEDAPLKSQCFGEDGPVTERPEPQQVNEIRQGGAAAKDNHGDGREEEIKAAATPRRVLQRPVNRCGHCYRSFYSGSAVAWLGEEAQGA